MIVKSKAEYYRLHRDPHVRWNTLSSYTYDEWRLLKNRRKHAWSVRMRYVSASEHTRFMMSVSEVQSYLRELSKKGVRHSDLIIGPCAPDHRVTLQAELRRSEHGYEMLASLMSGTNTRRSIPHLASTFTGLVAKNHLDAWMDATSRDCLDWMLETYPDSIIEFSCYDHKLGALNWNTIFWEVRNY